MEHKQLTEDHMININKIDKTVTIGILVFKKQTNQNSTQQPIVTRTQQEDSTRNLLASRQILVKTKTSQHKRLIKIQSKLPPKYNTTIITLIDSLTQVSITRKKLRDTISIAPSLQKQHLQKLAIALELDGKYPNGKTIQQLLATKQMK